MFRVLTCVLPVLLIGCGGDEKQLPTDITTPEDRKPEATPAVPKESEAEAVAFIKARIAQMTENRPERIEKLKVLRQKGSGRWRWPNNLVVSARRDIDAVWPGRARIAIEFIGGEMKESRLTFNNGTVGLLLNDGSGLKSPGVPARADEETAWGEMVAEVWLPVLAPATDPQAILFDRRKQPFANQMAETVKLALPQRPVYTLWFDPTDGTLGVITYAHLDQGALTNKQILLAAHKMFEGVKLPTQFDQRRNGTTVQEWTISRWEFPDKIEDAVFDQKK
jgi:hypothetical protein